MDIYLDPKITEIMPLVRGTVDSQRIPSNDAKIKTVISVFGKKINVKNSNARKVYKITKRFFLDLRSPR